MRLAKVALLFLVVIANCDWPPTVCTAEAVPALEVSVRDAALGRPVRTAISIAVVPTGSELLTDTLQFARVTADSAAVYVGAYERPGTYALRVEAPGYTTWTRTGLVVRRDECHVTTLEVEVALTPATASPLAAAVAGGSARARSSVRRSAA